jgi:hypothetical protein
VRGLNKYFNTKNHICWFEMGHEEFWGKARGSVRKEVGRLKRRCSEYREEKKKKKKKTRKKLDDTQKIKIKKQSIKTQAMGALQPATHRKSPTRVRISINQTKEQAEKKTVYIYRSNATCPRSLTCMSRRRAAAASSRPSPSHGSCPRSSGSAT